MAQTQEQWFNKIKSFVPKWFFESEEYQEAHFQGMAKVFEQLEIDVDEHVEQTFITTAINSFLDGHGAERKVSRLAGEFDAQYRERIRTIKNESNKPDIKRIVDLLLMVGECTITEDFNSEIFCNRENFVNRGEIILEDYMNTYSILVDKQVHDPYSFFDREYFCDREDYVGQNESSDYVFNLILEAVNKNKASSTLYRIIERI